MPDLNRMLNKLSKWRSVFAGWQLGTRPNDDGECRAVRDHREVTILLRAEVSMLTRVLLEKKIVTHEELQQCLYEEAEHLDAAYAGKFSGFTSQDDGIGISTEAIETMRKLNFPP